MPRTLQNTDPGTASPESGWARPESVNASAEERAKALETTRNRLQESWEKTRQKVKKYYDRRHKQASFVVGDWVQLSTKHIRLKKVMKKLSDRYIGPFQVEEKVGINAYKLRLPQKYGRLHPTFHVSLLELYARRTGEEPPEPIDIDGEPEFEVERILDAHGKGKKRKWLVRWKGWSDDDDT